MDQARAIRAPRTWVPVLILSVLIAVPYARTGTHAFIRFDDYEYVVENPLVKAGLSRTAVVQAFSSVHMGYWLPLTWISHMVDVTLFGLRAGAHHLVNVLLHLINAALLLIFLERLTGRRGRSFLVAAWFALHPLRVESVAWIAERKDLLSGLFFLLCLLAYARYTRSPGPRSYLLVLLTFGAGLLSKPMLVTLPLILLLLDFWPLGRAGPRNASSAGLGALRGLLLEKAPLFLLAAAAGAVTLVTKQQSGIMKGLQEFPLSGRIANALLAPVLYLGKAIWPASLAVFYPQAGPDLAPWKATGAAALLIVVSGVAFMIRRRRPALAVGWAWSLMMLVPVLGLVQVGMQARADRFTYLPHIGLFLAAVWILGDAAARIGVRRELLAAAAGGGCLALAVVTGLQVGHWKDSVTLFTHALKVAPDSWLTRNNLGVAWLDAGRPEEAAGEFGEALRIKPDYLPAWFNLGHTRELQGREDEAVALYQKALSLDPDYAAANLSLGAILGRQKQYAAAAANFRRILKVSPNSAAAHFNLGIALEMQGLIDEARTHYQAAARLDPSDLEARAALERVAVP